MPGDPLALGARLEENAGPCSSPQHGGEALTRGRDAALLDGSTVVANAELTLALVQIEPYRIHGGWPPGVCLVLGR